MPTRKKRILYLSNSYPDTVSGVTTVVTNILGWMKKDFNLGIICPNTNTKYAVREKNGVIQYRLPSYPTLIRKDVRFITPNPLQVQKAYRDFKPDIVHMHDPSPASVVLRDLAIKDGVPVIFTHHFTPQMVLGYLPHTLKIAAQKNDGLNNAILQITCRQYEGAHTVIVPTMTVKKDLETCTTVPIRVISSGVDIHELQNIPSENIEAAARMYKLPENPFALYIGRIDPEKNLETLVSAWAEVIQSLPKAKLVIVGEGGVREKLMRLAKDLNIHRSITWTGLVPADELPAVYKNPNAHVFVMPSAIESQSIATLMSLAAGVPVIAAQAGALPEIIHDGRNGFLCNPEEVSAFSKKLVTVLQDKALARKMGKNGNKIAKNHDVVRVIREYKDLYEKTLLLSHHPNA